MTLTIPLVEWFPVARGHKVGIPPRLPGAQPQPWPAHVGLWLDRMLDEPRQSDPSQKEKKGWPGRQRLYDTAVASLALNGAPTERPAVGAYRLLFARWRRIAQDNPPTHIRRLVEIEARSRLLLHPASKETVTEGGLLLHHTYGVPYLPGSAVKGAARSWLWQRKQAAEGDKAEQNRLQAWSDGLLGQVRCPEKPESPENRAEASLVDFWDALWIPEPPPGALPGWSPLARDIVNPHHPDYYTTKDGKRKRPKDGDEPNPIQRLTVAPGARFLLVLEAPASPLVEPWIEWLIDGVLLPALEEEGLGAWTSAGYGRLARVGGKSTPERPPSGSRDGIENSKAPAPLPTAEWYRVRVTRNPGTGELCAQLPGGRAASAVAGTEAEEFLATLPEDLLERLMGKRRQVTLEVQVNSVGRRWCLAAGRAVEES